MSFNLLSVFSSFKLLLCLQFFSFCILVNVEIKTKKREKKKNLLELVHVFFFLFYRFFPFFFLPSTKLTDPLLFVFFGLHFFGSFTNGTS